MLNLVMIRSGYIFCRVGILLRILKIDPSSLDLNPISNGSPLYRATSSISNLCPGRSSSAHAWSWPKTATTAIEFDFFYRRQGENVSRAWITCRRKKMIIPFASPCNQPLKWNSIMGASGERRMSFFCQRRTAISSYKVDRECLSLC